jgi:hypothetical protein
MAPAGTSTEFAERASKKSNLPKDWINNYKSWERKSAEELAEDTYTLYKSNNILGIIDNNNKLKLSNDYYTNIDSRDTNPELIK